MNLNAQTVFRVYRYEAACLLLVYAVYIVVLCFDLRISEFVLRKLSPCCTCLDKGSGEKTETRPLIGWSDDTSLRVHSRARTDSGIFQDDSGYSHLSLSLHGLNEIPEGETHCFPVFSTCVHLGPFTRLSNLVTIRNMFACLRPSRA